jgi:phosphoribosylanthranilate isomerase
MTGTTHTSGGEQSSTNGATRVKICGITSAEDRDAAVRAGADAVGVIADVPVETPRELAPARATELVAGVPPLVTGVLVTMPGSVPEAVALQRRVGADALQLHGSLDPEDAGAVRERIEVPLLVGVEAEEDDVGAYATVADALLVDSTGERGGGGTGETHDWDRTRRHRQTLDVPVILAGGLTPENVGDAVERVRPFGVDVASGVERVGGVKDHEAVERFVAAARTPEESS